jgi:hypothetical protein
MRKKCLVYSLWDAVQIDDEEIIESDADGGSEVDDVSINSDYPDVEQVANDFEERENDPVEDRGAATVSIDINEEENNDFKNGPENIQEHNMYYLDKNGSRWRKVQYNKNVRTRAENIISYLPGVKVFARNSKSPLECFLLFINEEMIEHMVTWTNQRIEKKTREWEESLYYQPTSNVELKALIGLLYLAGVFRNNHRLTKDFWKTDGTGFEIFRVTMAQRRFEFLVTCLRFDNK